MEYTTRLDENSTTRAHVNYQCPCGCTAGLMYNRESGSEHLGQCCCGRLLWLGDDAEAVVVAKFEPGIGYDISIDTVTLPWGDTAKAVLANPARTNVNYPMDEGHDHDHSHEGHEHSHEHGHDESAELAVVDGGEHTHEHDDDGHIHVARATSPTEHEHDHEHEGHAHTHEHEHEDHDKAHHDHEHHDDGHIHVERPRVKDVVCGMMIDPATAAGSSEYKGETYYFCALSCKQQFDADPTRFVKATGVIGRILGRS